MTVGCRADAVWRLRPPPQAIVLAHLHPDHACGLKDGGASCPVYVTKETWSGLAGFAIADKHLLHYRRRHEIIAGVAYGTDLEQAREVIETAARSVDVDSNRPVEVFAREFNDSSIDFTVRWWSGSEPIEMHRSRDRVLRAIKASLDQAGIEIPFPQVSNWFREPLRVWNEGRQKE